MARYKEPFYKQPSTYIIIGLIVALIAFPFFFFFMYYQDSSFPPSHPDLFPPQANAWGVENETLILKKMSLGINSYVDGMGMAISMISLTNITGVFNDPDNITDKNKTYATADVSVYDSDFGNFTYLMPLRYPAKTGEGDFAMFLEGLFNGSFTLENFTDLFTGLPLQFIAYKNYDANMIMLNNTVNNIVHFLNETLGWEVSNVTGFYEETCYRAIPSFEVQPYTNYTINGTSIKGMYQAVLYSYSIRVGNETSGVVLSAYSYVDCTTGIPLYSSYEVEIWEGGISLDVLFIRLEALMWK